MKIQLIINNKKTLFTKIKNVLCSNKLHLFYDQSILLRKLSTNVPNYDNPNKLTNPNYIVLSLNPSTPCVTFDIYQVCTTGSIYNKSHKFIFYDNYICYKKSLFDINKKYLAIIDNKLTLSFEKQKWCFINDKLLNNNQYIACDENYNIYITTDYTKAINLYVKHNVICYIKPKLKVDYENNNILFNDVHRPSFINNSDKNILILLAGGNSTRFKNDVCKQLYTYKNKTVIEHSIDTFINNVDTIMIVVNSKIYDQIEKIINKYGTKIQILVNNVDCRLESIYTALSKIDNCKNVIIHDSARPFITPNHVKTLLNESKIYKYVQFCLNITNGLHKNNDVSYEIINRDDFIELCSPICMDFNLCKYIHTKYMCKDNRISWEYLNILDIMNIDYKLINDNVKYMNKITTIDDILNENQY